MRRTGRVRPTITTMCVLALLATACGSTVRQEGQNLAAGAPRGAPQPGEPMSEDLDAPATVPVNPPGANMTTPGTARPAAGGTGAAGSSAGNGAAGVTAPAAPAGGDTAGSTGPRPAAVAQPGSGPASPTTPQAHAPAADETRVSDPILVGVLAAGDPNEGASQFGMTAGNTISAENTLQAMITHYEQAGGIAGRPLETIYRAIPVTTSNYNTQLQSDCAAFTQDNSVEVVVSAIGYYNAGFEQCLANTGTPHIEGGQGLTDDHDFATFPDYYTPTMPSYDERFRSLIASGVSTGHLQAGMTVGVMVEDCPQIQRAYAASFRPAAEQAGLVVQEFERKCTEGFQDVGAITTASQSAVFQFRANGVETVMFATYPSEVDLTLFVQAASSQGWEPHYYLDSRAAVARGLKEGTITPQQAAKMAGVGWVPAEDVSQPRFETPAQRRCVAIMSEAGIHPETSFDHYIAFTSCDAFAFLEAALTSSGGSAERDRLRTAVGTLGASAPLATPVGASHFTDTKRYGVSEMATFGFDGGCSCFVHTSEPRQW